MAKVKVMVAGGILAAIFAVSAEESSVWYEGNGVTVSGVGEASVSYRSASETSAWLDITVADGATAELTSLANGSSATLSIQKLGGGLLAISSARAASLSASSAASW